MADMKIVRQKCYRQLNKNAGKGQIVFAGSSLCELFPVNEMLVNRGENMIVYNRGISGDTIPGYRQKINDCILDLQPKKLFINIGTNDMNPEEFDEAALISGYEELLNTVLEAVPGVKIYVLSYYPINEEMLQAQPWPCYRTNARVASTNAAVRAMCGRMGLKYVEVGKSLTDENGQLKAEWTMDGMHMYPEAYETVLDELMPYIKE